MVHAASVNRSTGSCARATSRATSSMSCRSRPASISPALSPRSAPVSAASPSATRSMASRTGPGRTGAMPSTSRSRRTGSHASRARSITSVPPSVPVVGSTAWQSLFAADGIDPKPGMTILINGAAGGVGTFAVQLAKWAGATVIGTGSAGNAAVPPRSRGRPFRRLHQGTARQRRPGRCRPRYGRRRGAGAPLVRGQAGRRACLDRRSAAGCGETGRCARRRRHGRQGHPAAAAPCRAHRPGNRQADRDGGFSAGGGRQGARAQPIGPCPRQDRASGCPVGGAGRETRRKLRPLSGSMSWRRIG